MADKTKQEELEEELKRIKLELEFEREFHKKGDNPNPFDLKAKGGRAGFKGGGMSSRGLGRAFQKGGKV